MSDFQPLSPAYRRRTRRVLIGFCAFAALLFVLLSGERWDAESREADRDQAAIVAAVLSEGGRNPSEAVATIQGQFPRLIAVARVDESGVVQRVIPERPAHRYAASVAALDPSQSVRTLALETGEPVTVTGHRTESGWLVLLRADPITAGLWTSAAIFVALLGAGAWLVSKQLERWFERRVAGPLRNVAELPPASLQPSGRAPERAGPWRETQQIAARFQELLQSVAETDARTRLLERDARRQIMHKELGFDRQLRRAKEKAHTDPLTAIRNRTFLEETLEPLVEQTRAQEVDLAAVMIDLDSFKLYNDTHGHQVGDALLRFAGALLRGSIRPTDFAIRYGGDEFLLLLPGADSRSAVAVAERITKMFGQYSSRLGKDKAVTMSAGVAAMREDGCRNGSELVAKADAALYAAKRAGKNTVQASQPQPCPTAA